ncbi:MAG: hypothetical protein BWY89_02020 [Bacteroidetes bacterium ADurb.BinA012]|nr:MAG: hypothetical protein BWY89_02020 [Bacteroidetes bacterium ADurb.BinA012]
MRFTRTCHHRFEGGDVYICCYCIGSICVGIDRFKRCTRALAAIFDNGRCWREENYYCSHLCSHGGYGDPFVERHLVHCITIQLNAVTQQGICAIDTQQVQNDILGSHAIRHSALQCELHRCRNLEPYTSAVPCSGNVHITHSLTKCAHGTQYVCM